VFQEKRSDKHLFVWFWHWIHWIDFWRGNKREHRGRLEVGENKTFSLLVDHLRKIMCFLSKIADYLDKGNIVQLIYLNWASNSVPYYLKGRWWGIMSEYIIIWTENSLWEALQQFILKKQFSRWRNVTNTISQEITLGLDPA